MTRETRGEPNRPPDFPANDMGAREAPSRARWFFFGLVAWLALGAIASALIAALS